MVSDETADRSFVLSRGGITIEVLEYGARLRRCLVPDAGGTLADAVPGFDRALDYESRGGSMGAILGRYGNRIAEGRIELAGKVYQLSKNDGRHTMHGGKDNFGRRRWRGAFLGDEAIQLKLASPDGDQGWPGAVTATVTYRLDADGMLAIEMAAVPDRLTFLNLIFHGYWNLAGHDSGSVLEHWLKVAADHFLPKNEIGVPSGELRSVENSPFDFRAAKQVGSDIAQLDKGYAHNLCLRHFAPGVVAPALKLLDPSSGRALTLQTDQPGVQVFTGNSWSQLMGKDGAVYDAHGAIAFETQLFPNTPNTPAFNPAPIGSGEIYRHRMHFRFQGLRIGEYADFLAGPL